MDSYLRWIVRRCREAGRLSIANDSSPQTLGSRLHWDELILVASGTSRLRIKGAKIRSTVSGASYTLHLFSDSLTLLASRTFTGTGEEATVEFGTSFEAAGGATYEIGYGSSLASNMRFAD